MTLGVRSRVSTDWWIRAIKSISITDTCGTTSLPRKECMFCNLGAVPFFPSNQKCVLVDFRPTLGYL